MQHFCKKIVTLGPVGYLSGSGTWATVCAIPVVWFTSSSLTLTFALISFFVWALFRSFSAFESNDPSEVVVDEVIGFMIAMVGISLSVHTCVGGFLLFRFFDISKSFGIRKAEKMGGVAGVVVDDVIAGVYTNLLLRLCFWLFL